MADAKPGLRTGALLAAICDRLAKLIADSSAVSQLSRNADDSVDCVPVEVGRQYPCAASTAGNCARASPLLTMMQIFRIAIRVCASLLLGAMPARAATIPVPAGGNLQQAINSASAGDTIVLAAGASFTGSFTLPAINGNAVTTIRTAGDEGLPGDGGRVSPANSGALAIIRAGSSAAAIKTAAGAHHWRLMLLEVQGTGGGDLISLGDGSTRKLRWRMSRTI